MRKDIIVRENAIVLEALKELDESLPVTYLGDFKFTRLRTCNAKVATFLDYAILVSYNTLVAFIKGDVLYDVLRYNYGYTATSAGHIAKFVHDYNVRERHTWREL